jgi:hypothetical protein
MDLNLVFMEFVPDGNQFLWHTYCPLMIRLKGDIGFFADKPEAFTIGIFEEICRLL